MPVPERLGRRSKHLAHLLHIAGLAFEAIVHGQQHFLLAVHDACCRLGDRPVGGLCGSARSVICERPVRLALGQNVPSRASLATPLHSTMVVPLFVQEETRRQAPLTMQEETLEDGATR